MVRKSVRTYAAIEAAFQAMERKDQQLRSFYQPMTEQEREAANEGAANWLIRTKHRHADVLDWQDDVSCILTVDAPAGDRHLRSLALRMPSATQMSLTEQHTGRPHSSAAPGREAMAPSSSGAGRTSTPGRTRATHAQPQVRQSHWRTSLLGMESGSSTVERGANDAALATAMNLAQQHASQAAMLSVKPPPSQPPASCLLQSLSAAVDLQTITPQAAATAAVPPLASRSQFPAPRAPQAGEPQAHARALLVHQGSGSAGPGEASALHIRASASGGEARGLQQSTPGQPLLVRFNTASTNHTLAGSASSAAAVLGLTPKPATHPFHDAGRAVLSPLDEDQLLLAVAQGLVAASAPSALDSGSEGRAADHGGRLSPSGQPSQLAPEARLKYLGHTRPYSVQLRQRPLSASVTRAARGSPCRPASASARLDPGAAGPSQQGRRGVGALPTQALVAGPRSVSRPTSDSSSRDPSPTVVVAAPSWQGAVLASLSTASPGVLAGRTGASFARQRPWSASDTAHHHHHHHLLLEEVGTVEGCPVLQRHGASPTHTAMAVTAVPAAAAGAAAGGSARPGGRPLGLARPASPGVPPRPPLAPSSGAASNKQDPQGSGVTRSMLLEAPAGTAAATASTRRPWSGTPAALRSTQQALALDMNRAAPSYHPSALEQEQREAAAAPEGEAEGLGAPSHQAVGMEEAAEHQWRQQHVASAAGIAFQHLLARHAPHPLGIITPKGQRELRRRTSWAASAPMRPQSEPHGSCGAGAAALAVAGTLAVAGELEDAALAPGASVHLQASGSLGAHQATDATLGRSASGARLLSAQHGPASVSARAGGRDQNEGAEAAAAQLAAEQVRRDLGIIEDNEEEEDVEEEEAQGQERSYDSAASAKRLRMQGSTCSAVHRRPQAGESPPRRWRHAHLDDDEEVAAGDSSYVGPQPLVVTPTQHGRAGALDAARRGAWQSVMVLSRSMASNLDPAEPGSNFHNQIELLGAAAGLPEQPLASGMSSKGQQRQAPLHAVALEVAARGHGEAGGGAATAAGAPKRRAARPSAGRGNFGDLATGSGGASGNSKLGLLVRVAGDPLHHLQQGPGLPGSAQSNHVAAWLAAARLGLDDLGSEPNSPTVASAMGASTSLGCRDSESGRCMTLRTDSPRASLRDSHRAREASGQQSGPDLPELYQLTAQVQLAGLGGVVGAGESGVAALRAGTSLAGWRFNMYVTDCGLEGSRRGLRHCVARSTTADSKHRLLVPARGWVPGHRDANTTFAAFAPSGSSATLNLGEGLLPWVKQPRDLYRHWVRLEAFSIMPVAAKVLDAFVYLCSPTDDVPRDLPNMAHIQVSDFKPHNNA